MNIEVSHPDGTRFTLHDTHLAWAKDVYPASEGWVIHVIAGAEAAR